MALLQKQKTRLFPLKDNKDFLILNFVLSLSNQEILSFSNKKNINFRIKSIQNLNDEVLQSRSFFKSKVFENLTCNQQSISISFKLYKQEIYDLKNITFGLCEEHKSWHSQFDKILTIDKSFFDIKKVIQFFYLKDLKREPDDLGINYFYNKFIKENLSISDFRKMIQSSDEFRDKSNNDGITFFSRVDGIDSLLRIPAMFAYFNDKKISTNIYDDNTNRSNWSGDPNIGEYISKSVSKVIFKNMICFDFTLCLNEFDNRINKYRYAMYEADELAEEWVSKFKSENLKKIIVPDLWCKSIFSKYFDNVSIVPLGTHYRDINIPNNEKFTFGYIARFESRKNHKLLIEAFLKKFKNDPKFQLKIHGPPGGHNLDEIKSLCSCSPNIKFSCSLLSEYELDTWWKDISCYVIPSSGEGFSHTPREALMRGIPTIVSNWSAHESLVKLGVVRHISPSSFESAYKAVLFNRSVGNHALFSSDDLSSEMEYVMNNRNECSQSALMGRQYLIENESWEICSKKLMDVIYEK